MKKRNRTNKTSNNRYKSNSDKNASIYKFQRTQILHNKKKSIQIVRKVGVFSIVLQSIVINFITL